MPYVRLNVLHVLHTILGLDSQPAESEETHTPQCFPHEAHPITMKKAVGNCHGGPSPCKSQLN